MKYQVILTEDEAGWFIAECPSLPGCVSQGETREQAIANIREAMEGWLAVDAEDRQGQLPAARTSEFIELDVNVPA
ncbi:type II toxin-antitoxin system HicB family antitoxin [bacterium]|nr:type II toxin-antitoxin system HicB family antitoxin [bacterium]